MLIGIVTDIHGAVEALQVALAEFQRRRVDVIVSLGDACDTYSTEGRVGEVAQLMEAAGAIGVWGNHDFGLCVDVLDRVRREAEPSMLRYMASMKPYLSMEGCRFSHVEPWLDANKVEDLWYFDGPPDTAEKAARSFDAVPERHLFVGHFHRWLVVTPTGPVHWKGESPIVLEGRTLTVVAPVMSGWCAIFDTATARLESIRCAGRSEELDTIQ